MEGHREKKRGREGLGKRKKKKEREKKKSMLTSVLISCSMFFQSQEH